MFLHLITSFRYHLNIAILCDVLRPSLRKLTPCFIWK